MVLILVSKVNLVVMHFIGCDMIENVSINYGWMEKNEWRGECTDAATGPRLKMGMNR